MTLLLTKHGGKAWVPVALALAMQLGLGNGSAARAYDDGRVTAKSATSQKVDNVYRYLLDATVLIVVQYPEQGVTGTGTGWIVDKERRLVVTNQHVVETQPTAKIVFPKFEKQKLQTNIDKYPESDAIDAVILDSDPDFDLALLQLESLPETARVLKLTEREVWPGEKVHTIAGMPNGTQGMWIYGTGSVRQVSEGRLANGSLTSLMESDIPINQGNSGAAVIDDHGDVVAVAEGYLTQVRGTSLCVGVESVKKYLDTVLPLVDPDKAEQYLTIGQRAYAQNRSDAAMEAFSAGIDLNDKLAGLHVGRGQLLLDMEDAATAIEDFTTALKLDPKSIDALRGRAMSQEAMGDPEAALADLTKAIQKNPRNAAIYNERGCLRTRMEDYENAEPDFSRAISIQSDVPLYLLNRGITRRNLGNMEAALEDVAKAVQMDPENVDAVNEFGLTFYANEQYKEAADMFAAAATFDQTNPVYPQNLGDAYQLQGEHASALEAYNKSLSLEGNNPYVWYSIGLSQHELGNLNEAVQAYNVAVEQDEEYAEAWYALGQSLEAAGETDQAAAAIEKAKELDPEIDTQ